MSSDETKKNDKEKGPWYMGLFKLLFFVAVFFVVIFTVMANIGGDEPFYKESVESYFEGMTGYDARITKLNNVRFFPSIIFDFEGLELRQEEADVTPVASLETLQFSTGFWDVALSNGQVKFLKVENFKALPGAFTGKAINLEKLSIEEKQLDGEAVLVAKGHIGKTPINASMNMEVLGKEPRKRKYRFTNERTLNLDVGQISMTSEVRGGIFDAVDIRLGEQPVLSGKFALGRDGRAFDIEGEFKLAEHGSDMKADLKFERTHLGNSLSGDVNSPFFHFEDFQDGSTFRRFVDVLSDVISSATGGFEQPVDEMRLDLSIDKFFVGSVDLGKLDVPITIEDDVMNIGFDDNFAMADIKGEMTIKAENKTAHLNVNLDLKSFDYGALQEKFVKEDAKLSGKADIRVRLNANAPELSGLMPGLKGSFSFIGGEGDLRSDVIDLWGGGLVNSLLPSVGEREELNVNCSIMDFDIDGGIAKSNALFMDTKRVTLAGSGQYNITQDNLNISLKPKAKEIAIGDISSGVNITGPLASPSISPDLIDLGTRIGGLLLGTVNPGFWAFTLTDMGLRDNHPCAPYLDKGKAEATEDAPAEEAATPLEEKQAEDPSGKALDLNE